MQIKVAVALAAVAFAIAGGVAVGQDDPVAARQALMKKNGAALGSLNAMIKGEAAFDSATAKAAFETVAADMVAFKTLFPEGSEGGDASPAIWSDRAGFDAAADKLVSDATNAAAATGTLEEVTAGFGSVAANCGACHQKYRS
jgi:cytochrome c556